MQISEQPRKVKNEAIPEWTEGHYCNKGFLSTMTTNPSTLSAGAKSARGALHLQDDRRSKDSEDEAEEQADSTE